MIKRVIIIGAGPCGLVALKEMRNAGHDTVLLERSARFGGVFASPKAYSNLHLTISNWLMAFSDFPDPSRLHYPSAEHYLQYLTRYVDHFGLERYIEYESNVSRAELRHGLWCLQVSRHGKTCEEQADALIVATGASHLPKPVPAQIASFTGQTIHSSQYNDAFKNQVAEKKLRVLVVGGGESGADMSAELGSLSPNITVWLRRPHCIGPRYLNTHDESTQVAANAKTDFPANAFLEAATTSRLSSGLNVFAYGVFRRLLWHTPWLHGTLARMSLDSTKDAPLRNDQATYVTKNQRMCEAWQEGRIEVLVTPRVETRDRICEFTMADGTMQQREFDAVVLCTGYRSDFSWLHLSDGMTLSDSPRSWYLHCFPEGVGDRLFFVGFARPHQGGIPPIAEMLSRYIALILKGERALPIDYAERARRDAQAEREYYCLNPGLDTLVDFCALVESVARRIGCEPRLPVSCVLAFNLHMVSVLLLVQSWCWPWSFVSSWTAVGLCVCSGVLALAIHSGMLFQWWFYPHWAVWYRQRGPDADPALLDGILRRVRPWTSTALTKSFIFNVFWSMPMFYLQRFLSIFLFPLFLVAPIARVTESVAIGASLRPKIFVLHDSWWGVSDLFLP